MSDRIVTKLKELVLTLKHTEYPHYEFWYADGLDMIHVKWDCPYNYPSKGEHDMSVREALIQFALMTTTEGWEVDEDTGFHDFLDKWRDDEGS